jgi:hypothetical protein
VSENFFNDLPSEGFVTNFIVIYEISDGRNRTMHTRTSSDMTPWLAEGMINFGQRALWQMQEAVSNEEDC